MERRFSEGNVSVETRADGKKIIAGYASVFHDPNDPGTEYELRPGLKERVGYTAFSRALNEQQDVRALYNHDPNHLLGRLGAGTLKLSVDAKGLRYEIAPPDTQTGRDVLASIERGDLSGSSFSFEAVRHGITKNPDGSAVRTLEDVNLFDVGPVVFPAYKSATAGMRAVVSESVDKELAELDKAAEAEAVAVRLRVLELDDGFRSAVGGFTKAMDALREHVGSGDLKEKMEELKQRYGNKV